MQLNATAASLTPTAYARLDAYEASKSALAAREQARAAEGVQVARAASVQSTVAGMTGGVPTISLVSASQSIPAALGRLREIVATANSGTLNDADRATLQAEYAQLSQQVATVIGSPPPNEGARSSTDKRDDSQRDPYPVDTGTGLQNSGQQPEQAASDPARPKPAGTPPSRSTGAHESRIGATSSRLARSASAVAQFQQHAAAPQAHISLVA